jgi:4-alpha-glucanotransferase
MRSALLSQRPSSGVFLPIFSLPSPYGIGDLGPPARRFVEFLSEAGQRFWQVLPVFRLPDGCSNPYVPLSAFAGNPLLVSPDLLVSEHLLDHPPGPLGEGRIDYGRVYRYKLEIFRKAFSNFRITPEYEEFCARNVEWLEDYASFAVLCRVFGTPWNQWPVRPGEGARREVRERWGREMEFEKFLQFLFFKEWSQLREHCRSRGVQLIGDLPFYFPHQSAEVWLHPELFKLDEKGFPLFLSGVPPDFYNPRGQFWGSPVYKWREHRRQRFRWWVSRIEHSLKLFDWVRLDHFRGFIRYWETPGGRALEQGRWEVSGGADFLLELERRFGSAPLLAEDLGVLLPEEVGIIDALGIPTLRVLLIALSESQLYGRHAPHEYPENCVACTSTHDSSTIMGWFESAPQNQRQRFFQYVGRELGMKEVHLECIKLLMSSRARLCIFPLQDILGLGNEARINRPGTVEGNWEWRALPQHLSPELAKTIQRLTVDCGRD